MTDLPTALVTTGDHPYFLWQTLVHFTHMRQVEYPTRYLFYVAAAGPSPLLSKLMAAIRDGGGNATAWNDWRPNAGRAYNPAMKPGLVGQWLKAHPEDEAKPFLLLDPDAIPLTRFIKAAREARLDPAPNLWFGSDTDTYTGPAYLKSKGEDLWEALCALVRVDPAIAAQRPGRGSQWLFTGQPGALWLEIADLSEKAYRILSDHASDVQTWCAEMYVTQLMLAREGIATTARADMRMVWAAGTKSEWSKSGFFHDAGVVTDDTGHFHKGAWRERAPFGNSIEVNKDSASAKYVELIRQAETEFPAMCEAFVR